MKKSLFLIFTFLCATFMVAQENKEVNKNKKVEFPVGGNCKMCKKRIEKAAYSVKGIKNADWNVDSGSLKIIIDQRKCSVEDVQKAIAKIGHDAGKIKADKETYDKLHHCCLYERLPE